MPTIDISKPVRALPAFCPECVTEGFHAAVPILCPIHAKARQAAAKKKEERERNES